MTDFVSVQIARNAMEMDTPKVTGQHQASYYYTGHKGHRVSGERTGVIRFLDKDHG